MNGPIPSSPALELAHSVPGRTRLRWRSPDELPSELIAGLAAIPGVEDVEYRSASRSLVVRHRNGFEVADLEALARRQGVALSEPGPAPNPFQAAAGAAPASQPAEQVIAVLEALLTLGLMFAWTRDMLVQRTFRLTTFLFLLLAGLSLYQFWLRRTSQPGTAEADLATDLELLARE
jgi:hypothetical protein